MVLSQRGLDASQHLPEPGPYSVSFCAWLPLSMASSGVSHTGAGRGLLPLPGWGFSRAHTHHILFIHHVSAMTRVLSMFEQVGLRLL